MKELTLTKFPSTKDYDQFKLFDINRDINQSHVRKLKNAIHENNLLYLNPIIVTTSGYIVDGQHRREAVKEIARENGEKPLLYYFVTSIQDIDISGNVLASLQMNNRQWQLPDYLKLYSSEGYLEYQKLNNFFDTVQSKYQKNIIDLKRAIVLTHDGNSHSHHGGKAETLFKSGKYKFAHEEFAYKMVDLLAAYASFSSKYASMRPFHTAIIWTVVNNEITIKQHFYEISRLKAGTTKLAIDGKAVRDSIYALEQMVNYKKGKANRKYLVHTWDIQ